MKSICIILIVLIYSNIAAMETTQAMGIDEHYQEALSLLKSCDTPGGRSETRYPLQTLNFTWSGTWQQSSKTSYTYDAQMRSIETLQQNFSNAAWQDYYRSTNSYDTQGNNHLSMGYLWQNQNWVYSNKIEKTYSGNLQETDLYYYWYSNTWNLGSRYNYFYFNERLDRMDIYSRVGNVWDLSSIYQYSYDTSGRLACISISFVNNSSVPNYLYSYTYNLQGNISELNISQSSGGGGWNPYRRHLYTYSQGNDPDLVSIQEYSNGWQDYGRHIYNYSGGGESIDMVYQELSGGGAWQNQSRYLQTNLIVSNSDEVQIPSLDIISAYPNPFSDHLNINIAKNLSSQSVVEIYNIKGQMLRRITSPSSKYTWDGLGENTTMLPAGMYYIRFRDDQQQAVIKVLKH